MDKRIEGNFAAIREACRKAGIQCLDYAPRSYPLRGMVAQRRPGDLDGWDISDEAEAALRAAGAFSEPDTGRSESCRVK